MRATSHTPETDAPRPVNFFLGTSFAVDQLAIDNEGLRSQLKLLRDAHSANDAVGMKLAAEGAGRLLGQMQGMAGVVARVSVEHINRRPRP